MTFLAAGAWHLVNKRWTNPDPQRPRGACNFTSAQHPGAHRPPTPCSGCHGASVSRSSSCGHARPIPARTPGAFTCLQRVRRWVAASSGSRQAVLTWLAALARQTEGRSPARTSARSSPQPRSAPFPHSQVLVSAACQLSSLTSGSLER